MNILNKKERTNRFHEFFSLVNSIEIPICKNCSNINNLKDGLVFLELLKYFCNHNKNNRNYLSLLNKGNNTENPFERMNIIFHTMSKIISNDKIKSRIEIFHNNIKAFLSNDNLIMEFLIYIIYLLKKSKYNNTTNKMGKQRNISFDTNKIKNHSCSQLERNKKNLNLDDSNKYKRKIINYNSVKDEKKSSNNEKNNFLFYINNKNENIINIDNIMNFRFTKGINNLKAQNNNLYKTKEIKSYVTKPKIIKYQSQYFNKAKSKTNNNTIRNTKSEINFNKLRKYFKSEEPKINAEIKIKEPKINKDKVHIYHIYKPTNYNPIKNIIEEENKLKFEKENTNVIKINGENEIFSYKNNDDDLSQYNSHLITKNESDEMDVCKLLKLSIDNIKDKDKFIGQKKRENQINFLDQDSEDDKIKNQKRFLNSRNNRHTRNKIKQKYGKGLLNNSKESLVHKENKRPASFSIKNKNNINDLNDIIINKIQKLHHYYLYQNYSKKEIENNNINKEEKIYNWLLSLKVIQKRETNIVYLFRKCINEYKEGSRTFK